MQFTVCLKLKYKIYNIWLLTLYVIFKLKINHEITKLTVVDLL